MKIILRGHIRNSFDDKRLYDLLHQILKLTGSLEIYMHTWNIYQNSLSWRQIKENRNVVDESIIYSYFGNLKPYIKILVIDDDEKIHLIGNTDGILPNTPRTPVIGWKRYWYGKFKIIEHIYNSYSDKSETILNTRFDVLCNSCPFNREDILKFIKENKDKKFTKNKMLKVLGGGVDNIYFGSINTQYILAYHFHHDLENIVNSTSEGQERAVLFKNDLLFPE
jgi:hypothetical protein